MRQVSGNVGEKRKKIADVIDVEGTQTGRPGKRWKVFGGGLVNGKMIWLS